jgi:hypothetical protein
MCATFYCGFAAYQTIHDIAINDLLNSYWTDFAHKKRELVSS